MVYGVMIAPALVIDEEVKVVGKMTGKEEIAKCIKEENIGVIKI
ncbi:MAG: thioredoxin family protein [bacterium]